MRLKLKEAIEIIKGFKEFKKDIAEEMADPESGFNKYGLQLNKFGDVIFTQLDFDDAAFMSSDYNNQKMVMTKLAPIRKYLHELGWDDSLNMSISQFYDNDNFPTYSFAVEFKLDGVNDAYNRLLNIGIECGLGLIILLMFFGILALL